MEETEKKETRQPKTIEELKQWYEDRHLPAEEVTRFFIGKNITEPKAFGIYKDKKGEFVVYKNKANGVRSVRYKGPDEAIAVGEILLRLKSEIVNQKMGNNGGSNWQPAEKSAISPGCSCGILGGVVSFLIASCMALFLWFCVDSVPNGYYRYEGQNYYHQGTAWFIYNVMNQDWSQAPSLNNVINKDNAGQYRVNDFDGKKFESTQWYYGNDNKSYDDDYDNDDDYDWDDDDTWDSDDTDWDSDW